MATQIRQSDIEAYLDEALPAEQMARIETALRNDPKLIEQAMAVQSRRDAGVHSLGDIWRRSRLSCPSREQLGSYLLGAMPEQAADYLAFHLEEVGCRYCRANLADLQQQQAERQQAVQTRRKRYFQSSAGYLRREG